MPSSSKPRAEDVALVIQDLLSYRIGSVATTMLAGAAILFRKEYDVSVSEWRTLTLLAGSGTHSLNGLARVAKLDKGQMSRVISALVARGLVERQAGVKKGLIARLKLTTRGGAVYRGLMRLNAERDRAFVGCLTAQEYCLLQSALGKLLTRDSRLGPAMPASTAGSCEGWDAFRSEHHKRADQRRMEGDTLDGNA